METTLQKARRELIAELQGLLHSKGCYDVKSDSYEIPTYQPNKNISIFHEKLVIMVRCELVEDKDERGRLKSARLVRHIVVETFDDIFDVESLYADDIQDLVNFIKQMDDDDFFRSRKEYDAYID